MLKSPYWVYPMVIPCMTRLQVEPWSGTAFFVDFRRPAGGFQSRRAVGVVGCWVFMCAIEWCYHAKTCQNDWGILGVWWSHQSIMWVECDWVRLTSQKHTYAYICYTLWVLFLGICSKHAHPLLVANRCIHVIIYTYYILYIPAYTRIHAYYMYMYVYIYIYYTHTHIYIYYMTCAHIYNMYMCIICLYLFVYIYIYTSAHAQTEYVLRGLTGSRNLSDIGQEGAARSHLTKREQCVRSASHHSHTMWGPPVIRWFINPINYSYRYHKP